mmetsp:Transcript_7028/g.17992  ORF Transcript_7028/g.17992 Transcript_7028/m.17992 type:complete len:267 (+) Transcript_7028:1435-2235(+)
MGSAQATAVVAAIAAHAGDELARLEILHDIDLVVRLHASEDNDPLPIGLHHIGVRGKIPPGTLLHGQLIAGTLLRIHHGIWVLRVAPDKVSILQVADQHAGCCDDAALPADRDSGELVVASADDRADGALLQLLDRFRRRRLHLIPEQQQAADAQVCLQRVTGHVHHILLRHRGRQLLHCDAQHVVAILGVPLGALLVVGRNALRQGGHLLIAALDVDDELVRLLATHHDSTCHPVMVKLHLLDNLQGLGAVRRNHLVLMNVPPHG